MKLEARTGAALLLAMLVIQGPAASAQSVGRVQTMTRQVAQFLELESRIVEAQISGDSAVLQAVLSDDFEQRDAQRPGTPVARADWLKIQAARHSATASIEQMAVHDLGSAANVSYLLRPKAAGLPTFMVDTWVRQGDAWRLKVRYASPVTSGAGKSGPVRAQPKL